MTCSRLLSPISENRLSAIADLKHPFNRSWLKALIRSLNDGGLYGYLAKCEEFTKEELVALLEEAEKEDALSRQLS